MGDRPPATLKLLTRGLQTLLVDGGRPRTRGLGVPVGGAADRAAWALGNALVGNAPDAPVLEVNFAGPRLAASHDLACVVFGSPFQVTSPCRSLRAGKTFTLHAGEELHIGGTAKGRCAYLCVRGGLSGPEVLGSVSSLEPLQAGAELGCRPGTIGATFADPGGVEPPDAPLRVLPGAQADGFDLAAFLAEAYAVQPDSNRMGVRLRGRPLAGPPREIASEPVCPGAVQVTRDGQPIVLGVDGQTIGGYPKVAHVIAADLDRLGQLAPGGRVRFELVTLEEAEALWHRRAAWLREWTTRLRTAGGPDPPATPRPG